MTRKVITTEDGTSSIWWEEMDEHYHSIYGALQESQHVFIQAGLVPMLSHKDKACLVSPNRPNPQSPVKTLRATSLSNPLVPQSHNSPPLHILEMGFGTGLNALLTLQYCQKYHPNQTIHYTTLEAYPVEKEMVKTLNFSTILGDRPIFEQLHEAAWNEVVEINPHFFIEKLHIQIQDYSPPTQHYHVIYFDAFAPTSQPELWSQEIFEKMYLALQPNGCLTTYCAKGIVKRAMKAAGFKLEPLPGPKNKREMTRAWKSPLFREN